MQASIKGFFSRASDSSKGAASTAGSTADKPSNSSLNATSVGSSTTASSGSSGSGSSSSGESKREAVPTTSSPSPPQKKSRGSSVVEELLRRSEQFAARIPFPVTANLIRTQLQAEPEQQDFIAEAAEGTLPIVHDDLWALMQWFIEHKARFGSATERSFYSSACTTPAQLLARLLVKRPIMFMTSADSAVLRDGTTLHGGFTTIGTDGERPPLVLTDYISYDEMQLSAIVSVFVPTLFINDGRRNNRGKPDTPGTFQRKGVYVGMVGARFERPGLMEWEHMVVDPSVSIAESGFGLDNATSDSPQAIRLRRWAEFYKFQMRAADGSLMHCLPTFAEAHNLAKSGDTRFHFISRREGYLNVPVYKARLRMILDPFLRHANEYAGLQGKRAWLHVVGLGLGVWELTEVQPIFMVQVYDELLSQLHLPHISDIVFGHFPEYLVQLGDARNGELYEKNGNSIRVHFSRTRNPADPVEEGKVLIAQYAWDGNSYPGNEYWIGSLSASGDPAAACCSLIGELQNPEINPHMTRTATLWPSQRIETLST